MFPVLIIYIINKRRQQRPIIEEAREALTQAIENWSCMSIEINMEGLSLSVSDNKIAMQQNVNAFEMSAVQWICKPASRPSDNERRCNIYD